MATWSTHQDTADFGNVTMRVWLGWGAITRTEKTVSFNFGVCFQPRSAWTSNSIVAYYGGVKKFAFANSGVSGWDNSNYRALRYTNYYAQYNDRNSLQKGTTEALCFSYSNNNISATTTSVNISIGVGWSDWGGTNKGTMTFSVTIPDYYENVTAGTVEINDKGDNTFTIVGTRGAAGVNNKINKSIIEWTVYDNTNNWWKVDDKYPREEFTGASHTIGPLYLSNYGGLSTATTRKVAALIVTDGERNDVSWPSNPYYLYKDINQYVAPTSPSNVRLEYSKSRLTIKEKWTLKWDAATQRNSISPIKGYRIRMWVNGVYKPIIGSDGRPITYSNADGTDYWYDTEDTSTSFVIWPGLQGIKPGDQISFGLYAYSKNGIGGSLWSGGGYGTSQVWSDTYTIQNAGVAHVKVDGQWKEGIVHVKVNGQWKEADVVYTKINGGWQESE